MPGLCGLQAWAGETVSARADSVRTDAGYRRRIAVVDVDDPGDANCRREMVQCAGSVHDQRCSRSREANA